MSTAVLENIEKKCGYCGCTLGKNKNFVQHDCFQPFFQDTEMLHMDENYAITVVRKSQFVADAAEENDEEHSMDANVTVTSPTDLDEQLIIHVSHRQSLYDHRTPLTDRTNLKKNALWQEISNLMGGALTANEAKKRWKYLRDCYLKTKKKAQSYVPSGSGVDALAGKKISFRYYNEMKFLDDCLQKSQTHINLSPAPIHSGSNEASFTEETLDITCTPLSSSGASSTQQLHENKKRKLNQEKRD